MVIKWQIRLPKLAGEELRSAYLYLPESYTWDELRRYPVLYMFDGPVSYTHLDVYKRQDYAFLKPVYEMFLGMQNEDKSAMDYGTLKTGNVHYSGPFYKEQVAMELMGTRCV